MAWPSQHSLKKGGRAKATHRKKDTDGKDTDNRKRTAADMYEMCRDGTFDDKRYICSVLDKMSLRVNDDVNFKPLSVHSHCSGTDAPLWALKDIGIKSIVMVASENDPAPALLHSMHHRAMHLLSDARYGSQDTGPCLKHGGKNCDLRGDGTPPDVLVASFVCKPYSVQNPKRCKAGYKPEDAPGSETFRFVVDSIRHVRPKFFILENVDGVTKSCTGDDGVPLPAPIDRMVTDLRSIPGYAVQTVSQNFAWKISLPQARGRTLFFGCLDDEAGVRINQVMRTFHDCIKFCQHHIYHIGTFLTTTPDNSHAKIVQRSVGADELIDDISYAQELKKNMDRALEFGVWPTGKKLKPAAERASSYAIKTLTPSTRARIDVFDAIVNSLPQVIDGSATHVLADVSQSVDRKPYRTDGMLPTLVTGSQIWSYTRMCLLSTEDLAASMGLPRTLRLDIVGEVAARKIIGNSYAVPLSAMALVAVCSSTGHLKSK